METSVTFYQEVISSINKPEAKCADELNYRYRNNSFILLIDFLLEKKDYFENNMPK